MTCNFYNHITPHMAGVLLDHYQTLLLNLNITPAHEVYLRSQCRYYRKLVNS